MIIMKKKRHLVEVDELRLVDHPGREAALVRGLVDDHGILHVVPTLKNLYYKYLIIFDPGGVARGTPHPPQ
jgi:hypothetical protein